MSVGKQDVSCIVSPTTMIGSGIEKKAESVNKEYSQTPTVVECIVIFIISPTVQYLLGTSKYELKVVVAVLVTPQPLLYISP